MTLEVGRSKAGSHICRGSLYHEMVRDYNGKINSLLAHYREYGIHSLVKQLCCYIGDCISNM